LVGARAVVGRDEAVAAIAVRPSLDTSFVQSILDGTGVAGHVALLAGRFGEASPLLEEATRDCYALDVPFMPYQASYDLGAAREATGDAPGACDAYAHVLAAWGKATPRSVTAERAREAMRRLACSR
jgi:hypothetical protein